MLTSLHIQNFKAWKDTGVIKLAPLTIIFGANSAGKSSIGHLLLALKQTALSADRKRALHLGDDTTLIDLGTFKECLYKHDLAQPLSFELSWLLPKELVVRDSTQEKEYRGNKLSLNTTLLANKAEQPQVSKLEFSFRDTKINDEEKLHVTYSNQNGKISLNVTPFNLVRKMGRVWSLDELDKFYRISDQSRAYFQNSDFIIDFSLETEAVLNRLYYLGPLREYPRRIYQWSGDIPESVGSKGEFSIAAILAATRMGERKLNRRGKQRLQAFNEFIASWLKDLGIIDSFTVKPIADGRKEYEVLVKTHGSDSEVKITDVGFGVSQVLPALVQSFYCPPNSTVLMEQPEIHLHPQVQAELADVFISAIYARENGKPRNTQLIIESHSEHLLTRIQRRIAEDKLKQDDIAMYFVKREAGTAQLEPLELDLFGNIKNWPDNFFGNEMGEIFARKKAAIDKKRKEGNKKNA
ncbi:Protein of unknown function (DUF3696) [Beggiatoa alba B18LD]|uniref:DUF3696 domain-containing protein n=1 Tax=Beggiatoa alba B18LD TaxID=395493 RepID=I3CI07_9GAMM|nr:DUF3696 domain-containing protein [Beggiatoa alba]EIJ43250.1 Protein of unknown function (DUF3696) [Beggiatoa alba B18LD]